jgi:hypothetical protein
VVRLIGIDPSLTATGVVDVSTAKVAALDLEVKLNWNATIRTHSKQTLGHRLIHIANQLKELLSAADITDYTCIVIENTTDFRSIPGHRRKQRDVAVTGAAFGAAVAATSAFGDPELYGTREWIPMTRTRGARHFASHKLMREYIRTRWPELAELTDDETFAAGVAIYAAWIRLAPDSPLDIWGATRVPPNRA